MNTLEIKVIKARGTALVGPVAARFDESGGTIGRADSNRLVLDDPDRTVSRVHAQVVYRDGSFFVVDRGSNPLMHQGQNVGSGGERRLADGDQLMIGGFELLVSIASGDAQVLDYGTAQAPQGFSDDPFADLLDGLVPSVDKGAAAAPAAEAALSSSGPFPNPMEAGPVEAPDPFADLLAPAAGPEPPVAQQHGLSDLVAPDRTAKAASIDAMFNLGSALGSDPLAMTPLADPLLQPNTASQADPLASLSGSTPPVAPARDDRVRVEHFGYRPPAAIIPAASLASEPESDPAAPKAASPSAQPPHTDAIADGDVFAGIDDLPPPIETDSPPAPRVSFEFMTSRPATADARPDVGPAPLTAPKVHAASSEALHPAAPTSLPGGPTPSPVGAIRPDDPAEADALLAAFLRGLGSMQQAPVALTPELLERIGELLRTSTEGTLHLLLTRQEFKREVRAQVTMIASSANNPLKFSPTVDVALAHLLGPGVRGFMPAEVAMRDAYQELRAHEFGVMVGMRAALAHVIEQFAPDALEQNIATRSRLDAIFSANRKARLWDQFVAHYAAIAKQVEDDFHSLFGKAFLKAYDEQIERMKSHDKSPGSQHDAT